MGGFSFRTIVIICLLIICTGCADRKQSSDKSAASETLEKLYPGAIPKRWKAVEGYDVASFKQRGNRREAWFDGSTWLMTVTPLTKETLPESVRNAFEACDYSSWELTNCLELARLGRKTTYVIDVERNKVKYDLYFTSSGVCIRTINSTDKLRKNSDFLPHEIPGNIADEIKRIYPAAVVYEDASTTTFHAIDIVDNNAGKKVFVDNEGHWMYTQSEIFAKDSIPDPVRKRLDSDYADMTVENMLLRESPKGAVYVAFFADNGDGGKIVAFNKSGEIIKHKK